MIIYEVFFIEIIVFESFTSLTIITIKSKCQLQEVYLMFLLDWLFKRKILEVPKKKQFSIIMSLKNFKIVYKYMHYNNYYYQSVLGFIIF